MQRVLDEISRQFLDSDFIFSRAQSDVPFVPLAWIDVNSYQDTPGEPHRATATAARPPSERMDTRREQQALKLSIRVTLLIGLAGVLSGLFTGSQAIIFDGIYSFVDVLITLLSLIVSQLLAREGSRRSPVRLLPSRADGHRIRRRHSHDRLHLCWRHCTVESDERRPFSTLWCSGRLGGSRQRVRIRHVPLHRPTCARTQLRIAVARRQGLARDCGPECRAADELSFSPRFCKARGFRSGCRMSTR